MPPTADDLQTPAMPPELIAALRGQDPNDPNAPFAYQPGMGPLMAATVPGAPASPTAPAAPAQPAPPPTDDRSLAPGQGTQGASDPTARLRASFSAMPTPKAPPPTDDRSLMPSVPQPPNLSNSPLAQLLTKTQEAPPTHEQYKPRLWERILGGVLGATQLRNPENAGAVASEVVNRRFNAAKEGYDARMGALYKQLPIAEAQSRIPQQQYENEMQGARLRMEQFKAQTDSSYKADLNEIRSLREQDQKQAALDKLNELADKNKNDAARTNELLEIKRQLVGVAQERVNVAQERVAAQKDDTGYTPGENREIQSRSRRYDTRVKALEKSRSDYVGSQRPSDVQALAAIDAEIEQNHQKMDAIEQDVMSRRPAKATPAPRSAAQPAPATAAAQPSGVKPGGGKVITDKALVGQYLQKAGGDKDKARQLILADGWRLK